MKQILPCIHLVDLLLMQGESDSRGNSEAENESHNSLPRDSETSEIIPENIGNASCTSISPNAMRKRRREEIARKVQSRKALITAANATHLDMTKVHSILSGPRLSWDWNGKSTGNRLGDGDDDDDSCGLVVDFHQDSRSALKTHISKAMSQMASKDISSQAIPATLQVKQSRTNSEDIKQIIQMKRRLIASQASQFNKEFTPPEEELVDESLPENLPTLEPLEVPIHPWQETQMPASADLLDSTQVFVRVSSPVAKVSHGDIIEEEIDMDDCAGSTQIFIPPTVQDELQEVTDTTQIYVPEPEPVTVGANMLTRRLNPQISKASSTVSIPPNSVRDEDGPSDEAHEEAVGDESDASADDSSSSSAASPPQKEAKSKHELSFEEWLDARKRRKKALRKQSKEARSFFEAEAEESEDEELGGIMRRGREGGSDDSEGSSSSDDDSDLEDLVASAKDEFDLLTKTRKDTKKLAKLHAKWQEERDAELEKAIEDKNFWRKKRSGLRGLDEDGEAAKMSRMQRKLKAQQDAYVQQYDADGNLLAPEYVSDSDYDSMEIDSDEFFDELSDYDRPDGEELDEQELAIRRERHAREKERRKKDMELKMEMQKRRQLLKAKLREERKMKERDKREIQAGLGIMPEEDREAFKLVSRTQGIFGYTQASASGITTQSTSASASTQPSPVFSFLKATEGKAISFKTRRSSIGSLELE